MAVVDPSSVDVPLSLFSSLNTELSPSDIPEGISPDNGDIVYLPGSVSTRPGYKRVFVSVLKASGCVTYEKSFVQPNKQVKNLYLTNDGSLWVEDLTASPGTATLLFASTATMASSVTAFGREYIALSDGVHGADVPIQYDGTNVYRVTQDGPGMPPTVVSAPLPSTALAATVVTPQAVDFIVTAGPYVVGAITYYSTLVIYLPVLSTDFSLGDSVTIAGNSITDFDVTGTIFTLGVTGGITFFAINYNLTTGGTGTGGTVTGVAATLSRAGNIVTAGTVAPHSLQQGYIVQISGVTASTVGTSIASIVLNNADSPGQALVTTASAHGLLPNNTINMNSVPATAVGGGIVNIRLSGDLVTVTTASNHGLQVGAVVSVSPVTNSKLSGEWYVTTVPTGTTFTYVFVDTDIASGADTGIVEYLWPLANINPELNYFTVLTCPTPTSFTIGLSYTDGTWIGGNIALAWDGKFYVTAVPSPTTFKYQQYGPDAQTISAGTASPFGQATPGIHQVQQCFLFASGAISAPSPPSTFVANGGQYLQIANLVIGPSNVVGRILLFTGAGGAYFFYIPVPAQVNGLVVSTATQINDNTSTTALLDFSDNTLYAAVGCSIPGNNLSAQVVLGPCAGFFTYASRLQAWGEHNKVQNFLNMAFDADEAGINNPQAWTVVGDPTAGVTVSLTSRPPGSQWRMNTSLAQTLSQSAYVDFGGNPILLPSTAYTMRLWLVSSFVGAGGADLVFTLSSASTSYSSTATFSNASMSTTAKFQQANFTLNTPATIPTDLILSFTNTVTGAAYSLTIDELELIYTDDPYLDSQERLSYVDNPEGFDGLTGVLGPEDDQSPIQNHGVIRNTLYLVTGGSLHETQDNGSTEPSGWGVNHVADNCGGWSIASIARNPQGIGSAGKEWMTWSGPDGAQIFLGQQPVKISQEIQSLWDAMDQSLAYQCWAKNDQTNKRCYYGIPLSPTKMQVLVMDYRNLAGEQIAELPPVHISFTGKMIASDLTRKWTQWNGGNFYCGELMYRPGIAQPVMVFGGQNPSNGANVYTLDPSRFTDDDFGIIPAYYTTYFFVSHEMEAALQLGSHRKAYQYLTAYVQSVGTITFTPYLCALTNPQAPTPVVITGQTPGFDYEMDINVITSRCAFKIQATPLTGQTDTYFSLQKMIVNIKKSPWSPVRGTSGGSY